MPRKKQGKKVDILPQINKYKFPDIDEEIFSVRAVYEILTSKEAKHSHESAIHVLRSYGYDTSVLEAEKSAELELEGVPEYVN
ncbi:MAG: hypothetical protein SH817_08395 [Leptospira sp.]|nr:hypothetical protein [Leptospira sp.]